MSKVISQPIATPFPTGKASNSLNIDSFLDLGDTPTTTTTTTTITTPTPTPFEVVGSQVVLTQNQLFAARPSKSSPPHAEGQSGGSPHYLQLRRSREFVESQQGTPEFTQTTGVPITMSEYKAAAFATEETGRPMTSADNKPPPFISTSSGKDYSKSYSTTIDYVKQVPGVEYIKASTGGRHYVDND